MAKTCPPWQRLAISAGKTCPCPGADDDFNDLVFALQFKPIGLRSVHRSGNPVPEPGTLILLCVPAGLAWASLHVVADNAAGTGNGA